MKKITKTEYKWVPIEKQCYVALDGKEFDTEQACLAHEERVEAIKQWFGEAKKAGMNGEEALFALLLTRYVFHFAKRLFESSGKEARDED